MVKAELGTKRTCPSCAVRFYDLGKDPVVCPKCGTAFVSEAILPSKTEQAAPAQPAVREKKVETEEVEPADIETVSLEEIEEGEDDETAGIEDVDLGEVEPAIEADDDTFLEEEEEDEAHVSDIIAGGKPGEEEI